MTKFQNKSLLCISNVSRILLWFFPSLIIKKSILTQIRNKLLQVAAVVYKLKNRLWLNVINTVYIESNTHIASTLFIFKWPIFFSFFGKEEKRSLTFPYDHLKAMENIFCSADKKQKQTIISGHNRTIITNCELYNRNYAVEDWLREWSGKEVNRNIGWFEIVYEYR